jgi:uncharacterized damage-inducible protein DinB
MESEIETLRAWFAYLLDTRPGYLDALAALPAEERGRDRGASFPTLLDIYAHSQGALYHWIKDCVTFPMPPQEGDSDAPPTIESLRKDEAYLRTQIQRFLSELTESDLSRTVHRQLRRGTPHDCPIPVRDALWHLVEEELQHRGELNALLWQIDADVPVVSWIQWAHTSGRIRHA